MASAAVGRSVVSLDGGGEGGGNESLSLQLWMR